MKFLHRCTFIAIMTASTLLLVAEGVFVQKSQPRRKWIKREFNNFRSKAAAEWKKI